MSGIELRDGRQFAAPDCGCRACGVELLHWSRDGQKSAGLRSVYANCRAIRNTTPFTLKSSQLITGGAFLPSTPGVTTAPHRRASSAQSRESNRRSATFRRRWRLLVDSSLLDLAEAIERLEAAAVTRRGAEGAPEAEALLYAALDSATREINAAIEGSNASTVRNMHGVELVRDVRRRVGHMVALLIAIVTPELIPASDAADRPDVQAGANADSRPLQSLANRDALKPLATLSEEEIIALFS